MTDFYGGLTLGFIVGILWNHVRLRYWQHHAHQVSAPIDRDGYGEGADEAETTLGATSPAPGVSVYDELTPERIGDGHVEW